MNRMMQWKKSIPVFLTAVFLATGTFGGHTVTAWATPVSGTANGDGVRVRASAVDGETVDSLSDGQEVVIEDETTGSDGMTWYQITYEVNGEEITGWVRSDLLVTSDDESGTEEESEISYVVADSIPDDVIPDGFEQTTVTYIGEDVPALYSEDMDLWLLYAVNAEDETDAGLFVYDEQTESLIPFVQFELLDGSVVLLYIPEEEQQLTSDRFVLTECAFEHGSIPAYQLSEPDELVAEDASIVDYYYMYGVNEIGETGWYVYNDAEGSIQKNVSSMQYSLTSADSEAAADTDVSSDMEFSMDSVTRMAVAVLAVISLLLLVLAIIFSVRYRRLRNVLEDETEDLSEYPADTEPKNKQSSGKWQEDAAEPPKKDKKTKKDIQQQPVANEKTGSGSEEYRPDRSAPKKSSDERRDDLSRRRAEPVELSFPSDDVDVMDLDSMEDEDYEALLNKYLDENFSDEEKEDDFHEPAAPDAVRAESDGMTRASAETEPAEENHSPQEDIKSQEPAVDEPMGESAVDEPTEEPAEDKPTDEPVKRKAASAKKGNAGDFPDDDYDMPVFLKSTAGIQEFDDLDLDLSALDWSEQEPHAERSGTGADRKNAASSKKK
ncbi:MAG: SH3 domain-containing protein [Clostridiales bacterium]|nr:SH3 domain-containing protein [Clostridiales bacterium]